MVPARLVQTKEYHFRNELPAGKSIQLLTPDGERDLLNVDNVEIQWVNAGTQRIMLSMKQETGGVWPNDWTPITVDPLENQSDWSSYNWDVTAAGMGEYEYKIRAAIVDGGGSIVEADSSDYSFVLSGN